jgi:uncharacterized membrane protein YeaQ/YmgE (transglycosylase-associated protein family)
MQVTDPAVMFLLVLAIGVIAGFLFDRLAGPSWLARQFSGSTRGMITSALVGVAGAFVGYRPLLGHSPAEQHDSSADRRRDDRCHYPAAERKQPADVICRLLARLRHAERP